MDTVSEGRAGGHFDKGANRGGQGTGRQLPAVRPSAETNDPRRRNLTGVVRYAQRNGLPMKKASPCASSCAMLTWQETAKCTKRTRTNGQKQHGSGVDHPGMRAAAIDVICEESLN